MFFGILKGFAALWSFLSNLVSKKWNQERGRFAVSTAMESKLEKLKPNREDDGSFFQAKVTINHKGLFFRSTKNFWADTCDCFFYHRQMTLHIGNASLVVFWG